MSTPDTLTNLKNQLTQLERDFEVAKAQVHTIDGAMSATKHFIQLLEHPTELEAAPASDPASVPAETHD
jgi:hypothetical protein